MHVLEFDPHAFAHFRDERKRRRDQQLRQQIASMRQSLVDREVINDNQLLLLEMAELVPRDFVRDMLADFIRHSPSRIRALEHCLNVEPRNEDEIKRRLSGLKETSQAAAAAKLMLEVDRALDYFQQREWESLKASVGLLKELNVTFTNEIRPYLALLEQLSFARDTNGHAADH